MKEGKNVKPHKDHTCILFEDGKCIYCGKIPEYPIIEDVLNEAVTYPFGEPEGDEIVFRGEVVGYTKTRSAYVRSE